METKPKPILRVGKIKFTGSSTLQSVAGHLSRTSPTPNANPQKTHLNEVLIGDPSRMLEDLAYSALAKHHIDRKKLRKDATIANDILLTVSPAWFRPDDPENAGTWDENRLLAFKAEATAFLKKGFGNRLLRVDLHLDEATPHIHAIVIPILPSSDKSHFRLSGKDMFNPKSLQVMQEQWERAMSQHGVGQRLKGSKTSHVKLKDYYSSIAADQTFKKLQNVTVTMPPERSIFESKTTHANNLSEWKMGEEKRIRDELRTVKNLAAKGRLYDVEKLTAQAARSDASASRHSIHAIAAEYGNISGELELAKEEISALRNIPIKEIAKRLEYDGEIHIKENAIDFIKRVGNVDYKGALGWLKHNFGHRTTGAALSEYIEKTELMVPVTKAEKTKQNLVKNQLSAMDAEGYRITVFKDARGWNFGKSDPTLKKDILSANEVIKSVPKLQEINHAGGNIYITPVDTIYNYVLVDDLNNVTVTELEEQGYKPAVLMETSPNNFQAILKIPKAISAISDRTVSHEAANMFFKDMNRARGDEKIVGLIHPMRLAGFTNRKPKYEANGQFPFVKLIKAVSVTCHKSIAVIKKYAESKLNLFDNNPSNRKPR